MTREFLYLSNQGLALHGPRLEARARFTHDEAGHAAFAAYLQTSAVTPYCLLADVIEEDFRLDTLPHVIGNARRQLVQRRLSLLFHGTRHFHAEFQGRERDGRRDDRVLLSALTNEDLLLPWLQALARAERPLQGIWSVPLLTPLLVKKLGAAVPHLLLVSYHPRAGMRQSYLQGEELKFSRLTPPGGEDGAGQLLEECRRTRQYLESQRLLPRDVPLTVRVIHAGQGLERLRQDAPGDPLLAFEFLPLDAAARAVGLGAVPADCGGEALFLHLLATHRTFGNPYATADELWHHRLWQVRLAAHGASAALILAALVLGADSLVGAFGDHRDTQRLDAETAQIEARHAALIKEFPPTPLPANEMRAVVDTQRTLASASPGLLPLMAAISRALEGFPQLHVTAYQWNIRPAAADAQAPAGNAAPADERLDAKGASLLIAAALHGETHEEAVLHGEVRPIQDYRSAQESVWSFMQALGRTPGISVSAVKMPLDDNPHATLGGAVGRAEQPDKLEFAVKITRKVPTP